MKTIPQVLTTATRLHGEIISWDIPLGTTVPYATLLGALDAAGFDRKAAREIAPRDAFSRACNKLAESRIIRRLAESAGELKFQFTRETVVDGVATATGFAAGRRLSYDFEAVLTLDKVTGKVSCEQSPDLETLAQSKINEATEVRRTRDVSRLVQRLFDEHADLFPVRSAGGCYFVPVAFSDFLTQITAFLAGVGGSLRRFPVPAGFAEGDRSVRESVADGMAKTIDEHVKAVGEFDPSTRESTIKKMVEKLNLTRFKAEAYAEFLGEMKADVEEQLKTARQVLRDKIAALGERVEVPEPPAAEVVGPVVVELPDYSDSVPAAVAEVVATEVTHESREWAGAEFLSDARAARAADVAAAFAAFE